MLSSTTPTSSSSSHAPIRFPSSHPYLPARSCRLRHAVLAMAASDDPRAAPAWSVAVVGAGVSGLAAAYKLRKSGVRVTVFEAADRAGGKIRSNSESGFLWDEGANTMTESELEASRLIDDLGLQDRQQYPNSQHKRYVVKDGAPALIPSDPVALMKSNILSTKSKIKLFLEPFLHEKSSTGNSGKVSDEHLSESVGSFFERHFGREVVEYLVDPFVAGTSAADPESLSISLAKKKTGIISPKRFVHRVRKQNESFRGYMHQDAHEFLNFLLNEIVDTLEKECSTTRDSPEITSPEEASNGAVNHLGNGIQKEPLVTWVHKNFQGILTNETKCLMCETITAKDETFFDLSIDIEQNSSLTSCLKNFFSTETLNAEDKFFCDKCCSLQEAQKRMKIKKAPHILVIHLKRFKFIEQLSRHKKLSYRVVYPMELKLSSISDDVDCEYSLFAVVVHLGSGPNQGHYVSQIKSQDHWLSFDDDNVEKIQESTLQLFYGSSRECSGNTDHGYILFYECLGGKN